MPLRYEAWTVPWDPGGFQRKVSMLPVIDGSGQGSMGFLSFPGDSSVDLSLANFDRLSDLVSDTESSLITVYDCDHDGTNTVIDEWILDRVPSHLGETREVSLSGPGLLSVFEKALVYAFDYPQAPTSQGDWIWGGGNILSNPDFEEVNSSPKQVELVVTATGGTYTITAAGDTTSAIPFDAQASHIEDFLQNDIAAINDVIVVQTSSSPRTFLIEMLDPLFGVNFSVNTGSLTGGETPPATMTSLDDGGDEITAWTITKYLAQGIAQQGSYDTWALSSTQNHTPGGKYSLFIDPGFVGATSNRLGGAQQVVNVTPGQVYQASVWVRPIASDIRIRLGLFTVGEEIVVLSASSGQTFAANTWNQISIPDIVMPDGINQVVLRIACTNTGPFDPGGFFVDDAEFLEGLVPTTIGDIWQNLLDDCAVDHAADDRGTILEWVDYSSFDAVNDSGGTPWDHDDLSFVARWGSNMTHVLDDTFNRGYEAELVRKATPVGGKTHDFHLYNPGGRDDNPSSAIHTAQPLSGGSALFRNPAYTAALVVGENGEYTEDTDASLANFGRLETFISDSEASETTSRQLLADNLFAFENANRRAVSFDVVEADGIPRPFFDYRPGDTIPMTMAPTLAKEDRRVQRIDYINTQPTQYVVVGSRVMSGEAAAFDLVGRMWRRLNRPGKFTPKGAGALPSDGSAVIDVAAADAPEWEKAVARYQCDGVDDHVEIVAATDETAGLNHGQIRLSSGTFFVDLAHLYVPSGAHMYGAGKAATLITNQEQGVGVDNPNTGGNADYIIVVQQEAELSDINFFTTSDFLGTCIINEYGNSVHDVSHEQGQAHMFIFFRGTIGMSYNLHSFGNYNKAMLFYDENWVEQHGIYHGGNGTTLWFDVQVWGNGAISGVSIENTGADAIVIEEIGKLTLSNLAIRTDASTNTNAAFRLLGTPGNLKISNAYVEAGYLLRALTNEGTASGIEISGVVGRIRHSIVDIWRASESFAGSLSLRDIKMDGSLYATPGDAVKIDDISGAIQISDFVFKGFRGSGFNLKNGKAFIHDGEISCNQHGILGDNTKVVAHDLEVTAGLGAANTYDGVHLTGIANTPRIQDILLANPAQVRYGINIADAGIERAIVVGNSGGDPSDFGTDAINDQGTDTLLTYPSDPTYGDNFFRSGATSGADQIEQVVPPTTFNNREFESARPVTPVQS